MVITEEVSYGWKKGLSGQDSGDQVVFLKKATYGYKNCQVFQKLYEPLYLLDRWLSTSQLDNGACNISQTYSLSLYIPSIKVIVLYLNHLKGIIHTPLIIFQSKCCAKNFSKNQIETQIQSLFKVQNSSLNCFKKWLYKSSFKPVYN